MSSETKPEVFVSFNLVDFLVFVIRLLPALVIFAAVQIYIFNYVSQLTSIRQLGWDQMMKAHGAQPGPKGGSVVYEFEGKINQINSQTIVVEDQGHQEEFSTAIARYTVVTPYSQFELWPTKVLSANGFAAFKNGDQVTVVAMSAPLSSSLPTVSQIIKVQSQ